MYVFLSDEGLLDFLKAFDVSNYSEEKGCDCPLCEAIRYRKIKKKFGF